MADPLSHIPVEHLIAAAAILPSAGPVSSPESVDINSPDLGRFRVRFAPALHGDLEDSWWSWRAESARRLSRAGQPARAIRYARVGAGNGELEAMLVE